MSKYYGEIGFYTPTGSNGVYTETVTTKKYYGDILTNKIHYQGSDKINQDLAVTKSISIIADSFILHNVSFIRYAKYKGTKWSVSSIDIQHPRIILDLGEVFNG